MNKFYIDETGAEQIERRKVNPALQAAKKAFWYNTALVFALTLLAAPWVIDEQEVKNFWAEVAQVIEQPSARVESGYASR